MSNSSVLPPIQTFAESRQVDSVTNFLAFSDSIVSITRGYGLEGYIDGTITRPKANIAPEVLAAGSAPGQSVIACPSPNNSTTPSIDEWDLRNARVAALIFLNVKDPRGIGLAPNQSALEMWTKILAKYNPRTSAAQTIAKERLKGLRFNDGDRFDVYFSNLERLKSEANEVGCAVTDEDLASQFLTSLPPTDVYAWIIQNYAGKSYGEIYASLTEIQLRRDLVSNSFDGGRPPVPSALVNATNRPNNVLRCANCNRRGHSKPRCYAPGGGLQGHAPSWWKPPRNLEATTSATPGSSSTTPAAMATVVDLGSDVSDIQGRLLPF